MTNNEKTLVILTPGFAKDEADSTCIPTQQNFVTELKEKHPTLNIIILALDYPYTKSTYQWYNNTVISFNGRNKGGLSKFLLRRKAFLTLKKINASNKIMGLLSFWYGECALIGKKFAEANDLKHICWIWGQDAKKDNKYIKRIPPRGDELAVLSDFLQDEFEKNHGIRPQHVVPPGINSKQFSKKISQKDIDVVAAGSLIPLKQYDIFINVVAEIKKQIPGIKAMLIGEGPEKNKLRTLIETDGLESNIILTGELSHSEVLRTMQRAKIFLHTSAYEGFGIVCLEALCAGADVISLVKPMHAEIENWHIAASKQDMIQKSIEILKKPKSENQSIIPYRIEESAQKMLQLFST
jgi:glycosyltransferase involved in cell wall biosynthesis